LIAAELEDKVAIAISGTPTARQRIRVLRPGTAATPANLTSSASAPRSLLRYRLSDLDAERGVKLRAGASAEGASERPSA
jgi:hypothetical protein